MELSEKEEEKGNTGDWRIGGLEDWRIGGLEDWRMRSVWTLGFEPGGIRYWNVYVLVRSRLGTPTSGIGK